MNIPADLAEHYRTCRAILLPIEWRDVCSRHQQRVATCRLCAKQYQPGDVLQFIYPHIENHQRWHKVIRRTVEAIKPVQLRALTVEQYRSLPEFQQREVCPWLHHAEGGPRPDESVEHRRDEHRWYVTLETEA